MDYVKGLDVCDINEGVNLNFEQFSGAVAMFHNYFNQAYQDKVIL